MRKALKAVTEQPIILLPFVVVAGLAVAIWLSLQYPDGGGLYGRQVMATGPFVCDGERRVAEWVNESERPLKVRMAEIWLGMHRGSVADFWVWLSLDDGNVLGHTNWDHYRDPVAPHYLRYGYAPDYVAVLPGQAVQLAYGCEAIGEFESAAVGDVAVTLWWVE